MNRIDKIASCAAIGLMLTGMMMGFILGRLTNKVTRISDQVVEISRDTVTVHDTTYLDHFREVRRVVTDTMWVKLPASEKSVFEGSVEHFADSRKTMAASEISTSEYAYLDENVPIKRKTADSDSLFVGLPYEQVTVSDSLFTAQISGYKPHLDWIRLTTPTKVVTVETRTENKPGRWSVGVTAGLGAVYNQNGVQCGPGVMVGVQYRF